MVGKDGRTKAPSRFIYRGAPTNIQEKMFPPWNKYSIIMRCIGSPTNVHNCMLLSYALLLLVEEVMLCSSNYPPYYCSMLILHDASIIYCTYIPSTHQSSQFLHVTINPNIHVVIIHDIIYVDGYVHALFLLLSLSFFNIDLLCNIVINIIANLDPMTTTPIYLSSQLKCTRTKESWIWGGIHYNDKGH